jgi:hypothetical protein
MRRLHRRFLISAIIACLDLSLAAQNASTFKARLSTVPVDFANAPEITGSGSATAMLTATKVTITGTFEGLRSPATVARIHVGPRGIRGPAIADLTVSKDTSGTIKAALDLTPIQVQHLTEGRFYIQVHSEKAPAGNLWGWLLADKK